MNAATPDELRLIEGIRARYSSFIDPACRSTAFPPALLAALVANETGLDGSQTRFEPQVFDQLADVFVGRRSSFGSIGAKDLADFVSSSVAGNVNVAQRAIRVLMNLATSWGPTQIMGYHVLGYHPPLSTIKSIGNLTDFSTHFAVAVELLGVFQKEFRLADPRVDSSGYFHCWNSGSPGGRTFDPDYAANGVRRMAVYESLPVETPEAT